MIFVNRFLRFAFRAASLTTIGMFMVASVTPLVGQTGGDITLVPKVGVIHATGELGRVHLNGHPFDVGRVGPGLQIGAGLQRVLGSAGWALEAQVMRSLFARASSRYRGSKLNLARDLPVTITSASIAVTTPLRGALPTYLKAGVGAKRHDVSWEGSSVGLDLGGTSDTQFMVLMGVGIRCRIADTLVEVELTDFASYADFGLERRFTNELSLTLGLPIQFD